MKKYVSLLLVITILISSMSLTAAAIDNDIEFLITDSFNGDITNSMPSKASTDGMPLVTVVEEGKNKALELSASEGTKGVYYPMVPAEENITFWAEIKNSSEYSRFEIYLKDNAGKQQTLITLSEDGKLSSYEPRCAYGFSRGRFTPIQLTYNIKHKRLSLYVNGNKVFYERYTGVNSATSVAGFGIKCTGKKGASVLLDNVAIYNGKAVIKSNSIIPKGAYNNETANLEETDSVAAQVGNAVYLNRSFDEEDMKYIDGYDIFENTDVTHETSVLDGNKYIRLAKNTNSQAYIQYRGSSEVQNMIVDMKLSLDPDTDSTTGNIIYAYEQVNGQLVLTPYVRIYAGGRLANHNGTTVATLKKYKWTNLVFAADFSARNYDIYIDGELVQKDIPLPYAQNSGLGVIRTGFEAHSIMGAILIDDLKVYEGKEPRVIEGSVKRNVLPDDTLGPRYLGTMKAIGLHSDAIYNGKGKSFTQKPIIKTDDGKVYLSEADIKTLFGESVSPAGAYALSDGYYSADETAKAMNYQRFEYETRVVIYSPSLIDLDEDKLDTIHKYLLFDKPSTQNIKDMFAAKASSHPRIIMNGADLERIKSLYKTDARIKKWGDEVIEDANAVFGLETYDYHLMGTEMMHVAESLPHIMNLSMAYHLTGNSRYVAKAWKFLENICKLPNWNPKSYLDVGELTAIVAIGYDWLYDQFTEEQRAFLEKTMFDRGVEYTNKIYYNQIPSTEAYTSWWNAKNNWNAVCNGGTMMGAMAIFEKYPDVSADLIRNATRALEYMMPTYYPAGAWEEGGGYWNYSLQYMVFILTSFYNTLGDDLGFIDAPGFSNTGWFGASLAGSTGFNAFGDGTTAFVNNPQVMWCASKFGDSELAAARLNEIDALGHRGTVLDMIYYDANLLEGASATLPLDTRSVGMEAVSLRERWYDTGATYLGFNGGKALRNHGHMDIGTFVVDMAGERFIMDPGAENYNADGYFSTKRYMYYRSRPEGHNTYVINPTSDPEDYGIDMNSFALSTDPVAKAKGAYSTLDMTQAHARDVKSAIRGYQLTDDRRNVIVRDEIELKGESVVHWFLHTKAEIEMQDANTAILTLNGKKVKVQILTNASSYSFAPADAAPLPTSPQIPQTNNASNNIRKLALTMNTSGRLTVTVKISQYDDPAANNPIPDTNIAQWTIPDGEVTPLPEADMIYADGTPLEDFDSKVTGYSILCPKKQESVPAITVSANTRYEVSQANEFGADTIIKVYSPADPSVYRVYRVNFYKLPPLSDVNGMVRYGVAEVRASDVPQPENAPNNVIDENIGTRWSADGVGQWLELELEDVYAIDKIGVSFMNGEARVTPYKLELSIDGENWTKVFDGKSLGNTSNYEFRDVSAVDAKFVRITCYGNNVTTWNSITEFAALGKKR